MLSVGRLIGLFVLFGVGACATTDAPRYALRPLVVRDQDLDSITLRCKEQTGKPPCLEPYESSFTWDGADNSVFRPVSEALILKPGGEARNVNAFDEVPDSSWFVNRIGMRALTEQEVQDGYCKPGKTLDPSQPDGAWLIDHGKDNGANPGFRVKSEGVQYMLKLDNVEDKQGERATAAAAIAARLYFAAGWWAPCDAVVYFRRSIFKLKEGLEIKANVGPAKKFDEKLLDEILSKTSRRGPLFRAEASRWLPGNSLGPFTYHGVRPDDPSDVIDHEHRRDLRGARLIAAWVNHFDAREQNSMSTWMSDGTSELADGHAQPKSTNKGYVRHWYIDLGDCFGSEWSSEDISRRLGHSYFTDFGYFAEDFVTFGVLERPWERVQRNPEAPIFGFYNEREFNAERWRMEYPNAAFSNMTEKDGAWAARIISRFSLGQIQAAVRAGELTEPAYGAFLVRVLVARQRRIEERYFAKLSPIADFEVSGHRICGVDLARKAETWPASSFHYRASVVRGRRTKPLEVEVGADGRVCIDLPSTQPDGGKPDEDSSRYEVVRITNGVAPGPLELHLYDRGPSKQPAIAGIERNE